MALLSFGNRNENDIVSEERNLAIVANLNMFLPLIKQFYFQEYIPKVNWQNINEGLGI